ncbi:sensor histidine kinase [Rathayibacter tanaceti]|uniref:histidine kinase n=2 Tax=Rathayibacter tanaceti TaxID=1671680 RepID=A0A166HNV0_9MICO|nr:histidine kinase [Rathayibacter tanaceti]KZX20925.1 Sensor histidine kinase DesK [Rathayibacter tanaceti]QHC56662.1 sensor histidine kinase [Rathayibacter tanaceti]TCO36189.1 histidine kinase [Rathayibacter tanaceti]
MTPFLLPDAVPADPFLIAGLAVAAARVSERRMTVGRILLLVALVGAGSTLALHGMATTNGIEAAATGAIVVGVGWLVGRLLRVTRARATLLLERRALADGLAEADRELALTSERARIARDVHDVMAQSLSIVLVQATGAERLVRTEPDRAEASLRAVADVARASLIEVRLVIESLGADPDALDQPDLDSLPHLVDRFRSAGLSVVLEEQGDRAVLSPGQQLAVYRIVQESLTNALRHSGGTPNAEVRLVWEESALLLEVASRGCSGAESSGSDHGVNGMRERAELAGGWLTAEEDDGGFRVTASIPAHVLEAAA